MDTYENTEKYNPDKEQKMLIVCKNSLAVTEVES